MVVDVAGVLDAGGLKAFHKDYSKLCSQPGVPLGRPISRCRSPASDGRIDEAVISEILPFLFVGEYKPNSITLASSELAPNMFEAGSCQIPLH